MYPDWPEEGVPLLPLPRCIGPTLKPFDFQGPQEIEFLEYLGEGLHAHVVKVKIHGQIYALKLFRFCFDDDWNGYASDPKDLEEMTRLSSFSEPFNAECRAFGRLQEAGRTELAVQCFGYVLLDEKHERALHSQLRGYNDTEIKFNGNADVCSQFEFPYCRGRFVHTTKSGKPPPIRGILKEFGQGNEDLRKRNARKILQDVIKMQQLGMVQLDVAHRQLINGKHADFSSTITTPHYRLNLELNIKLTPQLRVALEFEAFQLSISDYWEFDDMIYEWNDEHEDPKDHLFVYAFSRKWGSRGEPRYNLRSTPERDRVYTYVDPRTYNWKYYVAKQRPPGEIQGGEKPRQKLDAKPPKWWLFDTRSAVAAKMRRSTQWSTSIHWVCENRRFVPVIGKGSTVSRFYGPPA
ncbi:kinetochore Sim4 complex subunit FTA2-domain-containing protein [Dactylonectria estremocensis]|uniref:Kinetochore Sim4 complex subunit FTA2-domain-containing protein n=1 Tax=Dactylonectria estremocensis TaxID=1079267 RepID=A0A9P9JAB8_9HYPO|nr:kinetochore Sim4 complex subunit FTA2-domain-containing protein [Dactylonectria estremocensis]